VIPAVVAVAGCYALGCLTAGYYLVRLRAGADLRSRGTGSTGARNVGRIAGVRLAAVTLALDCAKGAIAVAVAGAATGSTAVAAAGMVAVVLGHVYPVQLRFHGGRGLATALGAMLVLDWQVTMIGLAAAAIVAAATRAFTAAGIVGVIVAPAGAVVLGADRAVILGMLATLAVILAAHRRRL
jgi:acyl phosphate:glycerol-3-phosphate acyltransferase